jgi:hypothetical protein
MSDMTVIQLVMRQRGKDLRDDWWDAWDVVVLPFAAMFSGALMASLLCAGIVSIVLRVFRTPADRTLEDRSATNAYVIDVGEAGRL